MCVKDELISTRLLSIDDKRDMLAGLIPIDALILHVKLWVKNGMYSYSDGSNLRYAPPEKLPMHRFRGNGKNG